MIEKQLAIPLGDRVLVEVEPKEKTINGIIIPDTVQNGENQIGIVVAVGKGIYTQTGAIIPMEVEVGDKVMLPQGSMGVGKVKIDEKEYLLCREQELLMVIK